LVGLELHSAAQRLYRFGRSSQIDQAASQAEPARLTRRIMVEKLAYAIDSFLKWGLIMSRQLGETTEATVGALPFGKTGRQRSDFPQSNPASRGDIREIGDLGHPLKGDYDPIELASPYGAV
jgi:hypothetical protein